MTTSPSLDAPSPSLSSGESLASLPRWRQFLSTLNWRRDPDYEQRRILHGQRMKQLESEIELLESEIEQLESEILQLDRENAKLESLLSCVDRLCFPPESSSNPPPSIESNCGSSCS
jgi:TolA-binding protein